MARAILNSGIVALDQTTKAYDSGPLTLGTGETSVSVITDFRALGAASSLAVVLNDVMADGTYVPLASPAAYAAVGLKRIDCGPGLTTAVLPGKRVAVTATVTTGGGMTATARISVEAA